MNSANAIFVIDPAPATTATAQIVALDAIPTKWDDAWIDLAFNAVEPNPFAEHWFLRPAIEQFLGGTQAKMIGVWQENELIGLLAVTTSQRYGRLPVSHVQNWLHYHCFYGAPLIRKGREALFWHTILNMLDDAPWAPNFLHLAGVDPHGAAFRSLCAARPTDIVHRSERAMLQTSMNPDSYLAENLRAKKQKEIRRLRARLEEMGTVGFAKLSTDDSVASWTSDFLAVEASGWKGREGSALGSCSSTTTFCTQVVAGAHAAGKLDMLKLTVDGKPVAMLINLRTPPGSFAFKIAFDEKFARYSPGVLIKIESMKMLSHPQIAWTDSCAAEDHPMINSLWAERREIVRVTVPLAGKRRRAVFRGARMLENVAARVRKLT